LVIEDLDPGAARCRGKANVALRCQEDRRDSVCIRPTEALVGIHHIKRRGENIGVERAGRDDRRGPARRQSATCSRIDDVRETDAAGLERLFRS